MNYKILKTFGPNAHHRMETLVKEHLKKGWKPLNGAIPTQEGETHTLYQTLINPIKTSRKPHQTPPHPQNANSPKKHSLRSK